MKKIIRIQQSDTAPLQLTWVINNICTKSCTYCPSELHTGKNHNYDWDNAREFFKMLFERYPKIHCSVSGGEPSLSPFLPEISKTFYDAGHTIGITSNAAKTVNYWKELAPYLNYICFSWHPEDPDPEFIQKVRATASLTSTIVRIMMHPERWPECVAMFQKLYAYTDISVEVVRISDHNGINRRAHIYSDEQLEWLAIPRKREILLKKPPGGHPDILADVHFNTGEVLVKPNAIELINQGLNNFENYKCEIGLKSLFVHWNGSIKRGNCLVGGFIGHINDPKNIVWPTDAITCTANICDCSSDFYINKWIQE